MNGKTLLLGGAILAALPLSSAAGSGGGGGGEGKGGEGQGQGFVLDNLAGADPVHHKGVDPAQGGIPPAIQNDNEP